MNNHIIHLKHCYIDNPQAIWNVSYYGVDYELKFTHETFDEGKIIIIRSEIGFIDSNTFLSWLSVFFGEDCTDPFQRQDTRSSFNRGKLQASQKLLQDFLNAAFLKEENIPTDRDKILFRQTMNYYLAGLRSGISMMPLTIGFFGLSMECVGNLVSDQNSEYHTLGSFAFEKLINKSFEPFKKDREHGKNYRTWQKYIKIDSKLVHFIRNAVYGHSLLHIPDERQKLVKNLHQWLKMAGASDKDAEFWFKAERLEIDFQTHAPGLYKIGLRSARLLIFLYLGIIDSIPFTEHDYHPFGEFPKNQTMKFNGMSISISIVN